MLWKVKKLLYRSKSMDEIARMDVNSRFRYLLNSYGVPNLECLHTTQIEEFVKSVTREDIRDFLAHDPWFANYIVNIWEYVNGASVLSTYPWNVCIPLVDYCNAACSFCNSWLLGKRYIELDEVQRFGTLLRHSKLLGLAGHGEPLIHPQFEELTNLLRGYLDPRCSIYIITNGQYLDRHFDALTRLGVRTYNISLNAASEAVHADVMGMANGTFPKVLESIERLVKYRKSRKQDEIEINISMVLVRQNIHEAAEFVELGNRLNVDHIYLRTLMPTDGMLKGLNYHMLPPYQQEDFEHHKMRALEAIKKSLVPVISEPDSWGVHIFPTEIEQHIHEHPPEFVARDDARRDQKILQYYEYANKTGSTTLTKGNQLATYATEIREDMQKAENPYGRTPHFHCRFIYYQLNLNDFNFMLNPCCYMNRVPGFEQVLFDGSYDFFEAWNSKAFVDLRQRLKAGPLYSHCLKCPFQG
jgi:pyruvate-formate lyase-activating enzyme